MWNTVVVDDEVAPVKATLTCNYPVEYRFSIGSVPLLCYIFL